MSDQAVLISRNIEKLLLVLGLRRHRTLEIERHKQTQFTLRSILADERSFAGWHR